MTESAPEAAPRSIAELADESGLRRIDFLTWRDLDHPDAGGSEIHATTIARYFAAERLDVTIRTGRVAGLPSTTTRDGYRVERAGGPLTVLARNPIREIADRRAHALVEVWHGINFLAPLWSRRPRIAIAHHVHAEQFGYVLPRPAARLAAAMERLAYPRIYRSTPLVTLSESTREELVATGYRAANVHVVSPGVDERFRPGGTIDREPLVVTVARLMPQKRVGAILDAVARVRERVPDARLVVVGDGPERETLERRAEDWATFLGRVPDDELAELYRRAWVVASASVAEGWGMTLTEAAACGTPAVATDIAGHRDAVRNGVTGILVADAAGLADALVRLLSDRAERDRLGRAAAVHASRYTWAECARSTFAVLASTTRR